MEDVFETYESKKPEPKLTNIAELFKKTEYKDKLTSMRELVKVSEIIDRPIIILGYKEDKMKDGYSGEEKDCFRMDFKFADDTDGVKHYIRTEARYLWEHLKAVNEIDPNILTSGTLVALICEGKKKDKTKTKFYYFAGTMDA